MTVLTKKIAGGTVDGLASMLFVTVGIVLGLSADRVQGRFAGPGWLAIASLAWVGAATVTAVAALELRDSFRALHTVVSLGAAFLTAVPKPEVDRPGWLTALSVAILVLAFAGAVPMLIVLWQRERDERQRAILAAGTAIAFGVTMLVVAAFTVVRFYTQHGPSLTPSWVLLTGVLSWVGAVSLLRERM